MSSDPISCGLHGSGVVAVGSRTVLINGKPAARMGDVTGCVIAATAPPVLGAPPQTSRGSLNPADDGKTLADFDKEGGELLAYGEHTQSDLDHDGVYDTHEASAGLLRLKSVQEPVLIGESKVSGDVEFGMANVSAKSSKVVTSTLYSNDESVEGSFAKLSVNVTQAPKEYEGRNAITKVGATGQLLHGEVKKKVFVGSDDEKTGVILGAGASAEAAKGEVAVEYTSPSFVGYNIQYKEKGSVSGGAIGLAGGASLYWNKVENRLYMGLDAGLKFVLGLEAEAEVSVGEEFKKPSTDQPATNGVNIPGFGTAGIPGTILIGNSTVLIG